MTFCLFLLVGISTVSAATVYNFTNDSHSNYFDEEGPINCTEIVGGDVLDCSGEITDNLYIDRPLNL